MKRILLTFAVPVVVALLNSWAVFGQTAASVSGSVVADTGNPVAGALVTAILVPDTTAPPAGFTSSTINVLAASNGTYTISGLRVGKYKLCAQAPRSTKLLDPCLWSDTQTYITLTGGQTATNQKITMATGTLLRVQINDPGGLLTANEGRTASAGMIVGIGGPTNIFTPLIVDSTTASGRSQSIAIPYSAALTLVVHSNFYKLADVSGNAITGTYKVPVSATVASVGTSTAVTEGTGAGTVTTSDGITATINITGLQGK